MIELQLTYHLKNTWYQKENIHVLGSAFYKNNLLKKNELADFFSAVDNEILFKEKLNTLSGHFAIIIDNSDTLFIAVDTIRTFPLFIRNANHSILISDTVLANNCHWNNQQIEYFKHIYCTLDNATLLAEWQQLQAGEYVIVNKQNLSFSFKTYYHHSKKENKQTKDFYTNTLIEREKELIKNIRIISANKTILVPLSGGYDSRYLVALLKKNNINNFECFTYGKTSSYEVTIAEKVCKQLNIKWHFVEYTDALLQSFFTNDWKNYSDKNHNYSSLPHEQDFFALYYLKKQNDLPKNAIILNGFCQDLLAGSILESPKKQDFKAYIENKNEIKLKDYNYENSWNGYQEWFVKNRVSKFIINSVSVYEYFGLDFYLPFWQTNWINFWYEIPYELRNHQQFYNDYLFNGIFKEYAIEYRKPNYDSNNNLNNIKKLAKSILPEAVVKYLQNQNNKNKNRDNNNTLYLYDAIYEKLNVKPTNKDFRINNIHLLYLLQNLQQDLKP